MSEPDAKKIARKKEKLTVRSLEVRDIFTIAGMLKKITGERREEIINLIKPLSGDKKDKDRQKQETGEEKEQRTLEAGLNLAFYIFDLLIEYAEGDLKKWGASLVGKTPEEFDQLPIDTPLTIIESLAESEDLAGFFQKVSGLYRKINQSSSKYMRKST